MRSEDFQDLAPPHPDTKIPHIEIGAGPADAVETFTQGILPAANHNPALKVASPAFTAATKANTTEPQVA